MQGNSSIQRAGISVQHNPTLQPNSGEIDPIGAVLMIAFPGVIVSAIVGYRKHQAAVLRRRLQRLNQIWQLDALKKRF